MTYALMQNKAGPLGRPDGGELRGRRRRRQMDRGARLLPAAARPAGRQRLADHRRDLHPDAQEADQRRRPAHDVLAFFDWAYKNGDRGRGQLDYVPLPAAVKALIRKSWAHDRRARTASRSTTRRNAVRARSESRRRRAVDDGLSALASAPRATCRPAETAHAPTAAIDRPAPPRHGPRARRFEPLFECAVLRRRDRSAGGAGRHPGLAADRRLAGLRKFGFGFFTTRPGIR